MTTDHTQLRDERPRTAILIRDIEKVPLQVEPSVLTVGLTNAEIGGYVRLQMLFRTQGVVSESEFREVFECSPDRGMELFRILVDLGALSDANAERPPEQRRESMRTRYRVSHQVPPEPWPTWTGERWTGDDIESARRFQRTPVVYCLYGAGGELLYIGSTGNMRSRLRGHGEKPWSSYVAHGCHSRTDADWLEAAAIRADRPPLNKDYWCAGKLDVVPDEHVASAGCVTR